MWLVMTVIYLKAANNHGISEKIAASVFSKNTKGRFLSSKACAYWKFILDVDQHPLALNKIISWLWSTADDQISEKEHETFDVHTKHWQYLVVRVCVCARLCVFLWFICYIFSVNCNMTLTGSDPLAISTYDSWAQAWNQDIISLTSLILTRQSTANGAGNIRRSVYGGKCGHSSCT